VNDLKKLLRRNAAVLTAIVLLAGVIPVSIAGAATTTYSGAWSGLQAFIASASVNNGDTVIINPATLGTINTAVTVGKSITITSSSPAVPITMTATNIRHFNMNVNGLTVTFQNITLDGGGVGGGIATSTGQAGTTLIIGSGTTVQNCVNNGYGGGVYSYGNVTIKGGAVISNNKAGNGTGYSGGGVFTQSTATIEDGAVISGNAAGNGAGVAFYTGLNISGGEIIDNASNGGGGGVYGSSVFTMTGGLISGNTGGSGGGVWLSGGSMTMSAGEISGNASNGAGGGIYGNGTVTITGGSIINNGHKDTFQSSLGGGIYTGTGMLTISQADDAVPTLISGNTSSDLGGGVCCYNLNMSGGTISDNTATNAGGGIYGAGFANFADAMTITGGSVTNNSAANGGGIYNYYTTLTVSDAIISGNTATTANGGGIYNRGVGTYGKTTVTSGSITGNSAPNGDGGGVYTEDYAKLWVGAAAVFSDNSASALYPLRDPATDAVYATNILGTQWTVPLTQGYNNYDINHVYASPATIQHVTVLTDGSGTASASQTVALSGDTVTLSATPKSDYVFDYWEVNAGDIVLTDINDPGATFTMPSADVTVTAHFKAIDDGGGGNGGGGGGDNGGGAGGGSIQATSTPAPKPLKLPRTGDSRTLAILPITLVSGTFVLIALRRRRAFRELSGMRR